MIYLVTTTQRCGSTWLTRMLAEMTGSQDVYMDGLEMGFRLSKPRQPGAKERLAEFLRGRSEIRVFKTHDVPASDFDTVCAAMPELRILTMQRDFKDVVVSRYFYMRHYWPTEPALGPLPKWFAEYLSEIGDMPDREALPALLDAKVSQGWAREWAAFEGEFMTRNALRLRYAGLLDGTEHASLEAFMGQPVRGVRPFDTAQRNETLQTGRAGSARFHRNGRTGQWRDWFTDEQGRQLDALSAAALAKAAAGSYD
jgi:hypothetical protein